MGSISPTGFPGLGAGQVARNLSPRSGSLSSTLAGAAALSPNQQREVERLQQIDRQVRQHEQAHLSVAGGYARGGAQYSYTTGPDGKRYAAGGEVSIDVSSAATPQATIAKMEVVKRAATAPANPSGQDRAVYAAAVRTEAAAQQQLKEQKAEAAPGVAGLDLYA